MTVDIRVGDCREILRSLAPGSVHCVVTSPPYFGLRDYGVEGQIGLEQTPEEYVAELVEVFREVRRVLRDDGTLWLNLGDSYAGGNTGGKWREGSARADGEVRGDGSTSRRNRNGIGAVGGLKPKDLIGIPWRVAFALQADGWWLRQDVIWHKPNPMPESVRDRCTKAHEYIFLLSKGPRYYFDHEAIREQSVSAAGTAGNWKGNRDLGLPNGQTRFAKPNLGGSIDGKRNRRSVWTVATRPFKGAHFATFPPDLVEPCILAGCPAGGTVLDPFGGAGTTGVVAKKNGRHAILVELNPEYADMARDRIEALAPPPREDILDILGPLDDFRQQRRVR